jgi:hypothetical protein
MRSFILTGRGVPPSSGGWQQVIQKAQEIVTANPKDVLKVYAARGGEPMATVIAEITVDGVEIITGGTSKKISTMGL